MVREHTFYYYSPFLKKKFNLLKLRFVLWPNIWLNLENVSCALEKDLYSAIVGWSVLWVSV